MAFLRPSRCRGNARKARRWSSEVPEQPRDGRPEGRYEPVTLCRAAGAKATDSGSGDQPPADLARVGRRPVVGDLPLCFCLHEETVADAPLQLDLEHVLLHRLGPGLRSKVFDDVRTADRQRHQMVDIVEGALVVRDVVGGEHLGLPRRGHMPAHSGRAIADDVPGRCRIDSARRRDRIRQRHNVRASRTGLQSSSAATAAPCRGSSFIPAIMADSTPSVWTRSACATIREHSQNIGGEMARRTGRSDMPKDPAATIRAMRFCRDAMIEVHRCVKPTGPAYHAASMVISAIDAMATFLTGERYYFSAGGSASSGADRDQDTKARESGEKPWRT